MLVITRGKKPILFRPRPPEEQAFVQAILESPGDEGIRLIFADWLDDHDNPLGEFIRVQCRLARLPEGDEERQELLEREQALWDAHSATWRQYLPPILREEPFERGFIETAHLSVAVFLTYAEQIFATTPLRRLVVRETPFFWGGVGVGNREPVRLAASPHVARLRSLVLRASGIDSAVAAALADSPHLAGLASLDLAHN
jgi:uncharacterized protein (TIGR02996 family)